MKAISGRCIHQNAPQCKGFDRQSGYGAFTVSKSAEKCVIEYIQNQEQHHRQWKFTAEFAALLEKHGIPLRSATCGSSRKVPVLRTSEIVWGIVTQT
jgi:putative transposase